MRTSADDGTLITGFVSPLTDLIVPDVPALAAPSSVENGRNVPSGDTRQSFIMSTYSASGGAISSPSMISAPISPRPKCSD